MMKKCKHNWKESWFNPYLNRETGEPEMKVIKICSKCKSFTQPEIYKELNDK